MSTVTSNIGEKQFSWSFMEDRSISMNGNRYEVDIQKISPGRYSLLFNGKSFHAIVTSNDFTYTILTNGHYYKIEIAASRKKKLNPHFSVSQKINSDIEIRSPMPGMVVRCEVEEGTVISAGDGLLILEAMKMENEIRATKHGTVKKILVRDKQIVDKGELLLIIE